MKLVGLHLPSDTDDALDALAAELNAPKSALADLFIRYAATQMPKDGLRAWAASERDKRTQRAKKLTGTEQLVLESMKHLHERDASQGIVWIGTRSVVHEVGFPPAEVHEVLGALRARGLIKMLGNLADAVDLDEQGCPKLLHWALPEVHAAWEAKVLQASLPSTEPTKSA